MAEENPPRSAPEAAKESPLDSSPLKDTVYSPPSYRNPKKRKTFLILAIVVVVLVSSIFLWRFFSSYESTDDAQIDGHLNLISSRIAGTVSSVYVTDNQQVQQGQLIAEIDPRDYQVALQRVQANLAQSQAHLRAANPSVPMTQTSSETTISTSQAEILEAQAGISSAERDYQGPGLLGSVYFVARREAAA